MTREEAIKIIDCYDLGFYDLSGEKITADKLADAFDMAIEALEGVCHDEWCTDCKEYDTEKKCCPRFNKVIREAMKRVPHEDGTLEVKVEDATKIGRVLISDDKHRGGLYYPDEDEPQGISFENDTKIKSCSKDSDLISRTEAIEALGEEPPVWYDGEDEIAERNQWRADIEAIKSMPSADRPKGEWIPVRERLPSEKKAVLICGSDGNRFAGELVLTDTGYKWGVPLCVVWVDIEDGDAWMPLPEPYKGGEGE